MNAQLPLDQAANDAPVPSKVDGPVPSEAEGLRIVAPAGLDLAFPMMGDRSARPPYTVPRAEFAPALTATLADRRDATARLVAKGSMTRAEADADCAMLEDLQRDLDHPAAWPREGRTHSWAAKSAELRRILTHRRKALPGGLAVGDGQIKIIEAIEGLHWTMTVELAWCDAFDGIADDDLRRQTIRAWRWAIDQWERRAADAGEPWARSERSFAAEAERLAAFPDLASQIDAMERNEREAAIALGIAVKATA